MALEEHGGNAWHHKEEVTFAERSAAEYFKADLDVRVLASKLPPPVSHIRYHADKDRAGKQQIRQQGLSVQQMTHDRYMRLQRRGCRTALWDNNL